MTESTASYEIGDGSKVVDLPLFLHTEYEHNDTLLAYPPETDQANLRFTSVTIKGPMPGSRGEEYVRSTAGKKNIPAYQVGSKVVLHYEENSKSGSDDLLIKYWYVGLGDSVIILSCTLDTAMLQNPLTVQVEQAIPGILQSIRLK